MPGSVQRVAGASTRDRILTAALQLFNEEGVAKVSTNRIAAELDISSGNLHYHFKSKEQLIEWLFRRLEHELSPLLASGPALAAIDDVWLTMHLGFETIERYRFAYIDIDYLIREFPKTGNRLRQLTVSSVEAARAMCRHLNALDVIRIDAAEIETLSMQMVFTATCWSTFARILGAPGKAAPGPAFAAYQALALMGPFLDEHARHYMIYLRSKYLK